MTSPRKPKKPKHSLPVCACSEAAACMFHAQRGQHDWPKSPAPVQPKSEARRMTDEDFAQRFGDETAPRDCVVPGPDMEWFLLRLEAMRARARESALEAALREISEMKCRCSYSPCGCGERAFDAARAALSGGGK